MEAQHHGTMTLGYQGTMLQWYHAAMVLWYHGAIVPWYHGTATPSKKDQGGHMDPYPLSVPVYLLTSMTLWHLNWGGGGRAGHLK